LSQNNSTPEKKKNLVWTLEGITNQDEAMQFLMLFEDTFPVYHRYMEQIYFRYSFLIPRGSNKVTIEPSYQLHERLNRVSEDALEDRHMYILPGDVIGKSGLYMKYPRMRRAELSDSMTAKLSQAIKVLYYEFKVQGEQIIPVFSKQTIREYEEGMPNMELSLYNLKLNPRLSPFLRDDIFNSIFERILSLDFG
jgi:hypothetical protein